MAIKIKHYFPLFNMLIHCKHEATAILIVRKHTWLMNEPSSYLNDDRVIYAFIQKNE